MKKIKRILASVMVLAMVLAVAPAAFATEYTGEGNALTDVTWTSGAMYIVTIPATVALGNTATISASNVRLSVGETLNVKLTGTSDTDNAFKLTSGSNELTYTVSKGTDNVAVGDVILSVPAGTATGEQVLTFNEPATAPNAGDYTGTVTFTIAVVAPVAVTGVTLDKNTLELTAGGAAETLTATVLPDTATDKTVTWSSSNTSVATVANGVVTPVAVGTATITATAGGQSATCTVKVGVLLTTITATGKNTYSQSVEGMVTVTLNNIDKYNSNYGWLYKGTIIVEPVAGYTITKCRFIQNSQNLDDDSAPFSIVMDSYDQMYMYPVSVTTSTGQKGSWDMDGVTSIEVYGYAN